MRDEITKNNLKYYILHNIMINIILFYEQYIIFIYIRIMFLYNILYIL